MNIFKYQGQEEDHYTHILMSILSYNHYNILPQFIRGIMPTQSENMVLSKFITRTRAKNCPQGPKKIEYVIGIAPYKSALPHNPLEDNSGSIPDAWICGENFNLLLEFKIRGSLDEGQINAHIRLLNTPIDVIRLNWDIIFTVLSNIKTEDQIIKYLIQNFLELKNEFKSRRKSSGMPKEVIGGKSNKDDFYFQITGSRTHRPYTVEKIYLENRELLNSDLEGIQSARRFIAKYVIGNYKSLPIEYKEDKTIINDFCVAPGRAEHKNAWNQWRLGSYIEK
jgi:hypothetical protein